jgi:ribosomal protein L11 methyltransferase
MHALSVVVDPAREDEATTALWDLGTCGVEVRPGAGGALELVAYFEADPDLPGLRGALPGARIAAVPVPEVDWVARFREGFRPFRVGRFLVAPRWEPQEPSPELLVVDPGRAFGTGTHETTRLCLQALEELASRRRLGRTLDLGSGTGLLAIAAERLGAAPVVASDLDPEAIAASRLHSRLNHAGLRVVRADGGWAFRRGCFDLVLANLMALLLIDRVDEISRLVAPGGALVVSGLLLEDVAPVRDAYACLGTPRQRTLGEWAALVFDAPPALAAPGCGERRGKAR